MKKGEAVSAAPAKAPPATPAKPEPSTVPAPQTGHVSDGGKAIQPVQATPSAAALTPERAIILLRATSRPEIRAQIMQRLDENTLFLLLEHPDTPPDIRETLVERFPLVI